MYYRRRAGAMNIPAVGEGGDFMRFDWNMILLLVIAIELGMIYVKLPRK
jgi:hypothetical protein